MLFCLEHAVESETVETLGRGSIVYLHILVCVMAIFYRICIRTCNGSADVPAGHGDSDISTSACVKPYPSEVS